MRAASSLLLACLALAPVACGSGTEATATERLWVSTVPTNPKTPLTAFATMRTGEGKYLGAFFSGTLLRGGHDVFQWVNKGKAAAELEFLQDGKHVRIRLAKCTPSTGFDHCLMVHGDPTGTVRYQSRKRWVVKRPGKRKSTQPALEAMSALAQDDAQLAAWMAAEQ